MIALSSTSVHIKVCGKTAN